MPNKYFIMMIAAGVLITLGGFLIWRYGEAKDEAGYIRGISEANVAASKASSEAARDLEKEQNETAKIKDADIDAELISLGVMRPDHHR